MAADKPYYPELDGLRAIAAWMVVFYHIGVPYVPGAYGVTLFFVLSGFLITGLLTREFRKYGDVDLKAFYIRRTLRIMPAFYAYMVFAIVLILAIGKNPLPWSHLISAATYTVNYYNAILGDPNTAFSHAWSLGIEEQYYLLWPITFVFLTRRKSVVAGILASVVAIWIVRAILRFETEIPQHYFYSALEMRADALLVGSLAGYLFATRRSDWLFTGERRFPYSVAFGMSILGVVVVASAERTYGSVFRDSITNIIVPVLFVVVIVSAVAGARLGAFRTLGSPVMVFLGRLSYSTYLYQQLVPGLGQRFFPHASQYSHWAFECFCVLALAYCSYQFVEKPMLRVKDRLGARRAKDKHPQSGLLWSDQKTQATSP